MGISLPQDPAIHLLGIYPKNAYLYNKDICSTMYIAALFVIARMWKQSRCPSTEGLMEKIWYIYTKKYSSAENNNEILKFEGKWLDLEENILSEVNQSQKDKKEPSSSS